MTTVHNTLPESVRTGVVPVLQRALAHALDLNLQVKQSHWTVRGPNFIGLHRLFDEVAEDVLGYADDLAERAVQLGGTPVGTADVVVRDSTLPPHPGRFDDERGHVELVAERLA